jgi:hypothetical protein
MSILKTEELKKYYGTGENQVRLRLRPRAARRRQEAHGQT